MSEELAIEILKQATIETTTGACVKCPRKDKSKTCIGCLDEAKEKILLEVERLKIIEEKYKDSQLYIKDFKDEIERLTISLQAQEELTMNWFNKVKKARNLFYEKCRISQNGAYIFNEVDYEELSNILGSDKE